MPDPKATQGNVGRATNVCARCQRTWESQLYPWWKDQPSYAYCAHCALSRWYEEQGFGAGRLRTSIRQGGKAH